MRWQMSCDRFVAFLDIMGFKRLVASTPAGDLYRLMRKFQDEANQADQTARAIVPGEVSGAAIALVSPSSRLLRTNSLLRNIQFSDALIVISRDASDAASLAIRLASIRIFLASLGDGIALRGAIAQGPVTADFRRSIFFGQPIVDAYLLEEEQKWFGIAEHESCSTAFPTGDSLEELGSDEIPISQAHKVPTPAGAKELVALNWTILLSDEAEIQGLLHTFMNHSDEKVRAYAGATHDFAVGAWRRYRGRGAAQHGHSQRSPEQTVDKTGEHEQP